MSLKAPLTDIPAPPIAHKENHMSTNAKAIAAFVLAFLTALVAQVADKTEFSDLTGLQWLIAIVSAVVTAGGVYAVPNSPRP